MRPSGTPLIRALPVLLVAMLALSGCSGTTPPSASPTRDSPVPTAEPTPDPPASIRISPVDIAILSADADVLASHDYSGDAAGMIAMLTDAIGSEPEEYVPGSGDCLTETTYTWASGADSLILKQRPDDPGQPYTLLVVTTTSREIGSLTIATSTGLSVGDDVTSVTASLPDDQKYESGLLIWEKTATYVSPQGDSFAFGGFGSHDSAGILTFLGAPGTMSGAFC